MPMMPAPELPRMSLAEVARAVADQTLPPVDRWNPTHCGHSHMRIARDGTWFHEGSPIGRPEMVRLFSTILRREPDGRFVLVTPAEKLDIDVEDAPFIATAMIGERSGRDGRLAFQLNTGELVVADAAHPLRFEARDTGPHPYLSVRGGLEALLTRSVYYELAERAIADGCDPPGVWSNGSFFAMTA